MVESTEEVKKYVIVDDIVCSGKTLKNIKKEIESTAVDKNRYPTCVGICLYAKDWDEWVFGGVDNWQKTNDVKLLNAKTKWLIKLERDRKALK